MSRLLVFISLLAAVFATGCIPYAAGNTARTVARGEFEPKLSVYAVPGGIEEISDDNRSDVRTGYASADFEGRWGLSDRSDIGLRVPSGTGAIVSYKRMLSGINAPRERATAVLVGAGLVNLEQHAFFEAAFLASGAEGQRTPYGGARFMHVIPIASGAVEDAPTIGVFGGLRIRVNDGFSISPELGIYHDPSALGLRERDIIFIPSVTFHWD